MVTKSSRIATFVFVYYFLTTLLVPVKCQDVKTLAVLEFDHFGLALPEALIITNRFRSSLARTGAYRIIERGLMTQILQEQDFQATGCTSDECAVEVGQLLGVQLMLAGSIGKIGNLYSFDLRIVDVGTGSVIKTTSHDIVGTIELVLSSGIQDLTNLITGVKAPPIAIQARAAPSPGMVDFITTPAGARLTIDGEAKGRAPLMSYQLSSNERHNISIRLDGYAPLDTNITVQSGSRSRLNISLQQIVGWLTLDANVPSKVKLNGKLLGRTPVTRLRYGTGKFALTATSPGYFPYKGEIVIGANQESSRSMVLSRKPKGPAVAISFFLPGGGQLYQGNSIKAVVFAGATIALGYLAYTEQDAFAASESDFERLKTEYTSETDLELILSKKAEAQAAFDAMGDSESRRNMYLAGMGGIWAINVIDIIF